MNCIILSLSTGQGHNSVADAIKEEFLQRGSKCDVLDAFAFISPRFSKVISKGHSTVYRRIPRVFNSGYSFSEKHSRMFREGSMTYRLLKIGSSKLARALVAYECDTVISTHPLASMMLVGAQKKYNLNLRTAYVATDYTCSPGVAGSNLQYNFVPLGLTEEFQRAGVQNVIECGIPVRKIFHKKDDMARSKQGIPEGCTHTVIMCGSMGCGPMEELAERLSYIIDRCDIVSIVCGSNKKLFSSLNERLGNNGNFRIYGFTDKVSQLLDSADIFVTKPGGISSSEALAKAVPMVLVNAVAGCEAHNKRYFLASGGAVSGEDVDGLVSEIANLLEFPEKRRRMHECLCRIQCASPEGTIYSILSGEDND